ncbi:MAG TPA: hypothetical protein VHB21_08570, partial [Minicystis sp.]|nr:hypothetical protein [Minicystis sp.]
SRIIAIDPHTPSAATAQIVQIDDDRPAPKMPDERVSLSPAVVASLNAPPPSAPPPAPAAEPEAALDPAMHKLEAYSAHEPTVLKARPRVPAPIEEELAVPTRSLAGYVLVAVVAVGVAALLLFGWTRWQAREAVPSPPAAAPP